MEQLVLTGIDQESYDDPKHYRLVCFIEGGGKLAIWGRHGETANVDTIRNWIRLFGLPLALSGRWTTPQAWSERHGHTHWLEERNPPTRVA